MKKNTAAELLDNLFDSQMFSEGNSILFRIPAQALKETILGDMSSYSVASALMSVAEYEALKGQMDKGGTYV